MFTRLTAAFRALRTRRRANREADEELQFHIEQETAAHVARGLTPGDARRAALRDLGGLTQARESVRDVRTSWVEVLCRDSAYAWRRAAVERGGTAAVLLTIAVGVASTAAVFSVVHAVLLRPLPVANENRLFAVYGANAIGGYGSVSYPRFRVWLEAGGFEDLAGISRLELDLKGAPWSERIEAAAVTDTFFRTLGVVPQIGRGFTGGNRAESAVPVVISDPLWRRRFAADPAVIGRRLSADQFEVEVVGVMPAGFERWRGHADMWVPLERVIAPDVLSRDGYRLITPVGRLASTASVRTASETLTTLGESQADAGDRSDVRVVSLRDDVVPDVVRRMLVVASAATLFAWLAICANLAMLLVSRGMRRHREVALRLALGASRGRVFVQLLVEGLCLTVVGVAGGLGLAALVVRLLPVWRPSAMLAVTLLRLDWSVVLVTLGLTASTAMVAVAAAASRTTRVGQLRPGGEMSPYRRSRFSSVLVATQVGLAVVVVIGASLFLRSLVRMGQVDLGFTPDGILTAQLSVPASKYDLSSGALSRYVELERELLARLAAMPGVADVTLGGPVFQRGPAYRVSIAFDDGRRLRNADPRDYAMAPASLFIGPGFMRIHRIPILSGREFRLDDDPTTPEAVVVNETMARLHWPGQDPVGRRVNFGRQRRVGVFDEPWATVIGVVADVRHAGIGTVPDPEVYRAQFQHPRQPFPVVVRTATQPDRLVGLLRETVRAIEPDAPLFDIRTLKDAVAEPTADVRYASALLSFLALTTVIMSAAGMFGLIAGSVDVRRREIAIRLALGATPEGVVTVILTRSVFLLATGATAGLLVALLAARGVSSLLFGVTALDPVSYAAGVAGIVVVGVLAAWIPARRASAVDPVVLLRPE